MLKRIGDFLKKLNVPQNARILAGVSGGPDSVVLLHLLSQLRFDVGIAHVNFQLRGKESDRDENFVKDLAAQTNIPFYSNHFDTLIVAHNRKISVQMAARELRYEWFNELAETHGYDFIAIAHHLDDRIETFLINLLRGTGISGLKGIPACQNRIIRPLVHITHNEILDYARVNKLMFVEDSSNFESDYLRNELRHKLIPVLMEIRPSFSKVMASNMENLTDAERFYRDSIEKIIQTLVEQKGIERWVDIEKLENTGHTSLLLHELLEPYGFRSSVTKNIANTLHGSTGKVFYSSTHEVLINRKWLVISPITTNTESEEEIPIHPDAMEIFSPLHVEFQSYTKNKDFTPFPDPAFAFLDFDTLKFPLILRHWKHGDRFKPLGMKGTMKLSDFFISHSYSLNQKKDAWLLADASGRIAWLVGQRISEDFRINHSTKTIYRMQIITP